ncbi:hypothetical protein SNEBB_002609 [Seison nebaliae]|nr:hypothetical protein SNEBB_002609 [Seison nebaliae]
MGIFQSRKKNKITEEDKAILQLKKQRDTIRIYQKRITTQLETDRENARTLLSKGQKDRALLLLKKKKRQETLLDRTDNQLQQLENLVHDIEFSRIQVDVVKRLREGADALKHLNSLFDLDDVHDILATTSEAKEYEEELNQIMHIEPMSSDEEMEIQREYEKLIDETETIDQLPAVPSDDLSNRSKEKSKRSERGRIAVAT